MHTVTVIYDELAKTNRKIDTLLEDLDERDYRNTKLMIAKAECLNGMAVLKAASMKGK